jgi:hypothetical protein
LNANCGVQAFGFGLQIFADVAIGGAVVSLGSAVLTGGSLLAAGGALAAVTLGFDEAIAGRRAIAVGLNLANAAVTGAIASHIAGESITSASIKQPLIDAVNPISGTVHAFDAFKKACYK